MIKLFEKFNEYYEGEKKFNPDYSLLELSQDLEFDHSHVYRVMSYKDMNKKLKSMVEKGKISFDKATRIAYRVPAYDQEEVAKKVLKARMSRVFMEKYLTKRKLNYLNADKEIPKRLSRNQDIKRDILNYVFRFQSSLTMVDRLPLIHIPRIEESLISTKRSIEEALLVLSQLKNNSKINIPKNKKSTVKITKSSNKKEKNKKSKKSLKV